MLTFLLYMWAAVAFGSLFGQKEPIFDPHPLCVRHQNKLFFYSFILED